MFFILYSMSTANKYGRFQNFMIISKETEVSFSNELKVD
jgi:hypothetical protein